MKLVYTLILLAFSHFAFGQDMDCSKFKTGKFKNIDASSANTFIKRTATHQFEHDKISGKKVKLKVVWDDECSYRLILIKGNKKFLKDEPKGESPDLIVNIIKTGENYYMQVAHFEGNEEITYKSRIRKLN
ncbi:MAG: hypothetical protein HKO56_04520 [Bacteroidia bacterium]|nr:hypothetical protein [Bacteroidia bacterium]NNC84518.1 hypothetical protein [Bacteroidia bacterium]NNM15903.1 hypothetical protein [Bacteroidia bacterium]